jgi:cell division transport system ATP-binding protein
MIQFLGVTKIYDSPTKPIKALDNVSFEINEGEFVFLVGKSGSGKTTIIRHLIREESPSQGKIYFADQDITKLNRSGVYQLRRMIGIIFQDFKLLEEKNIYENVAFAMEAAGHNQKEIDETVPYVLDIVNLADRAENFPRHLSGGEKQRVAIARAISNNPKLLIADEPTGNLDPEATWDIVQILSKINKWGTTVIMCTHGSEIVDTLQKRVLRLEKGKLIRDDKKGTYDRVDEYTLKNFQTKSEEPEKSEKSKDSTDDKIKKDTDENITNDTEKLAGPIDDEEKKKEDKKKEEKDNKKNKETKKEEEKADKKQDEKSESKSKKDTKKVLEKADKSSLKILKLSKGLEEKLIENGYKDVEDILKAGIAKVNESLEKKEIKQLAKSIKKFLTTE